MKALNGAKYTIDAPIVKPFGNPITLSILVLCICLIAVGFLTAWIVPFFGFPVGALGLLIWMFGQTNHPDDPRTAGLLHFYGKPVIIDGVPVVVGGDTILAPYWPIRLSSVQFTITNVDKDFEMTVTSKDDVKMKGFVSVCLRVCLQDALDYLQAGQMNEVFVQLDDIVYEKAKKEAREHTADEIDKDSELISGPLRKYLVDDIFQTRAFGVEVVNDKVQARFDMPESITDVRQGKVVEGYQRANELLDYDTINLAAQKLRDDYEKAGERVPLSKCIEEIKHQKLIRDQRVSRIETDGKVNNVILTDANLNMGGGNKGGKKQ